MTSASLASHLLAGLVLTAAASASAATYTDVPGGATIGLPFASFGNAANPSGDAPAVGEVFSVASDAQLSSFSFYALGQQSASIQLNVALWNPDTNAKNQATNTVGTTLVSVPAVETFDPVGGFTTLEFDNLGLNLSSGTRYVAFLTSSDPAVTGIQLSRTQTTADASGFGIGNAHLGNVAGTGWQLPFGGSGFLSLQYTAVVAAVPEPEAFALLLAGFGLLGAVKRRQAARA